MENILQLQRNRSALQRAQRKAFCTALTVAEKAPPAASTAVKQPSELLAIAEAHALRVMLATTPVPVSA